MASCKGAWTFSCMRRRASKPPGIISMFAIARSVLRIISFIMAGLRAISIACRKLFGSLRTWASSGFCCTSSWTWGLAIIIERINSGFCSTLCIIGESIICRIISGFCINCCCMVLKSIPPPRPGPIPPPMPPNPPEGKPPPNGADPVPNPCTGIVEAAGDGLPDGTVPPAVPAVALEGAGDAVEATGGAFAAAERTRCMVCPSSSPFRSTSSCRLCASFSTCPR
mmetsp:Transcript_14051/g.37725  ORF Transcript_14051/g.37725 Transcript_14051/m.37725 type:complete len:225 (+) Transcript_14051:1330-2004(+)